MFFQITLLLLLKFIAAEVPLDYDYLAETMRHCTVGLPLLPEGQENEVSQSFKDCAVKFKKDLFCTRLCQLISRQHINCWSEGCTLTLRDVHLDFRVHSRVDNSKYPNVTSEEEEEYIVGAENSPKAIASRIKKLYADVSLRSEACLSNEMIFFSQIYEEGQPYCQQFTVDDIILFEEFFNCYKYVWAEC